ncbi:MAG: NrtA/SsuA/CpmA family ABC transporter substrate-binding protein [Rhodospirillaceae bacterium]
MYRKPSLIVMAVAALLAGLAFAPPDARADDHVIRIGNLKIVHGAAALFYQKFAPSGYKVEIRDFESPVQMKDALGNGEIDLGMFGLAAATIGGASKMPIVIVASACAKGMAVVVRADGPIKAFADLQGKKVGLLPGTTQEVVFHDRAAAEGLTAADIQAVRVTFSEMAATLAKGEIDAFVGAEPGPAISVASGVGRVLEYPYSTATGSLNMVLATHQKIIDATPDLVKLALKMHKDATEFAASHPKEVVEAVSAKLNLKPEVVEKALPNVEFIWKIDAKFVEASRYFGQQLLEMKKIEALPDYSKFINLTFNKDVAQGG